MRRTAILAAILLAGCHVVERSGEYSLNLPTGFIFSSGITGLTVKVGRGSIGMSGDPDSREVRIDAKVIARARSLELAEETARRVRMRIDREQGKPAVVFCEPVGIEPESPEDTARGIPSPSYQVRWEIRVPPKVPVTIEGVEGPVEVRRLYGDLQVRGTIGRIDVAGVQGDVEIDGIWGAVTVAESTGRIRARVGEGPIAVREITGDVEVGAKRGGIQVKYITGDVTVLEASGAVVILSVDGNLTFDQPGEVPPVIHDVKGTIQGL